MLRKLLIPGVLLVPLVTAGCATQANLVDLQREMAALKLRVANLSGGDLPAAPSAPAPDFTPAAGEAGAAEAGAADTAAPAAPVEVLDLMVAVDRMTEEVADLRGQVEGLTFNLSTLAERSDARLSALEQNAGLATLPGTAAPEAAAGETGEAAAPAAAPEARVVLPGVRLEKPGQTGVSEDIAFSLAQRDLERGHYSLAATGFANFLDQHPDSRLAPDATYSLGESLLGQKQTDRAIRVWQVLLERHPKSKAAPKALLALGEAYRSMDNISAAEAAFKRLIARFPEADEARQAKLILSELR